MACFISIFKFANCIKWHGVRSAIRVSQCLVALYCEASVMIMTQAVILQSTELTGEDEMHSCRSFVARQLCVPYVPYEWCCPMYSAATIFRFPIFFYCYIFDEPLQGVCVCVWSDSLKARLRNTLRYTRTSISTLCERDLTEVFCVTLIVHTSQPRYISLAFHSKHECRMQIFTSE